MTESSYWALTSQASTSKITRSMMGKLAKLCNDYDRATQILTSALKTSNPAAYLGKTMANLKDEITPPTIPQSRSHEPEIVLQARLRGWPVRKSRCDNGEPAWWVAGVKYDHRGVDIGG